MKTNKRISLILTAALALSACASAADSATAHSLFTAFAICKGCFLLPHSGILTA